MSGIRRSPTWRPVGSWSILFGLSSGFSLRLSAKTESISAEQDVYVWCGLSTRGETRKKNYPLPQHESQEERHVNLNNASMSGTFDLGWERIWDSPHSPADRKTPPQCLSGGFLRLDRSRYLPNAANQSLAIISAVYSRAGGLIYEHSRIFCWLV